MRELNCRKYYNLNINWNGKKVFPTVVRCDSYGHSFSGPLTGWNEYISTIYNIWCNLCLF